MEGIVIHGWFDPNYIIFRNVEKFQKLCFLKTKNLKENKNLLEYLKNFICQKNKSQNWLIIWQICVEMTNVLW